MNWKLFASTFVLIFLAELGDKTQLAAMARAAGGGGARWTVFAAASSALVFSTLIAVVLGSALTRIIPETYIKLAAGVLFIVFGVLIVASVLRPAKAEAAAELKPSVISNLVLRAAAEFEAAAADDYARLAADATDGPIRQVMEWLAAAERAHFERLRKLAAGAEAGALQADWLGGLPAREQVVHDVAVGTTPVLQHAIEHEEATARFYRELAALTPIPALRRAFTLLADEEQQHAARLAGLLPAATRAEA